jgi:hypothetical protein
MADVTVRLSASHALANSSFCKLGPVIDMRQVIGWTVSIDGVVQLA